MISITAEGRIAHQPEFKMLGDGGVCEFRLLSSRWSKGQEVTEAVTFFCYDGMAEEFAESIVKGQEVKATGIQETQFFDKDGVRKTYVKYRLTWFQGGRKPRSEFNNAEQGSQPAGGQPARPAQGHAAPGQRQGVYQGNQGQRPPFPQGRAQRSFDGNDHGMETGHGPEEFF